MSPPRILHKFLSPNVGGGKKRPTAKKTMQCELRAPRRGSTNATLASWGKKTLQAHSPYFQYPKGKLPQISCVLICLTHVFITFCIFKYSVFHEITPKSNYFLLSLCIIRILRTKTTVVWRIHGRHLAQLELEKRLHWLPDGLLYFIRNSHWIEDSNRTWTGERTEACG